MGFGILFPHEPSGFWGGPTLSAQATGVPWGSVRRIGATNGRLATLERDPGFGNERWNENK